MRRLLVLLALLAWVPATDAQETAGAKGAPPRKRMALDRAFHGRILSIRKREVTIAYDFEDPAQLEDFEEARPPRLLAATGKPARIEGGRLILEGSTSIRHKMESVGGIRACFKVRVTEKKNVGAVLTEPVLSDFYVVYNLFDYRFHGNGAMHIAACGLHEDEGAEDPASGLVNYRDIFTGNLAKKVEVGKDIEVEVRKEGWKEFFRAGDVKGRGSSKGKTKEMRALKFGLFVHESEASFDDLVLTCELSDEYLDLENLRLAIDGKGP
jgi:hypothetical protein